MVARRPFGPIDRDGASLTGFVAGEDPPSVVMVPSLGRGAADFTELADALARAGIGSIGVDPRGVASSAGDLEGLTLHDYAADVAAVIEAHGVKRVDVIGHAFGNRVARCLATDRRELVGRVVLLAAGGRQRIDPVARAALARCFDATLDDGERLRDVSYVFFAPGNDARVWRDGWFAEAAAAQVAAVERTPFEPLSGAGDSDVLIIQGIHDRIAPPEVGRSVAESLGPRARYVEVEAGHALLPERPREIATAVIDFLREARM